MNSGTYDLPMSEYLALPYLSSGLCSTLLTQSPWHAQYEMSHKSDDATDASDTGTAIHSALLEGIDIIERIDAKDWRTNAAKDARDAARAAGRIPVLTAKVERIQQAVSAIRDFLTLRDCEIRDCFSVGNPEVTGVWEDDGGMCKLRADWVSASWHISVKTTEGSASPSAWIRRQLGPCDYDTQLAFYERGLGQVGHDVPGRILLCEQNPPFGCCVIGLAPSREEYAHGRVQRAMDTWRRCQQSKRWPSYAAQTHFAEADAWMMAAEEEVKQTALSAEELSGGIPA